MDVQHQSDRNMPGARDRFATRPSNGAINGMELQLGVIDDPLKGRAEAFLAPCSRVPSKAWPGNDVPAYAAFVLQMLSDWAVRDRTGRADFPHLASPGGTHCWKNDGWQTTGCARISPANLAFCAHTVGRWPIYRQCKVGVLVTDFMPDPPHAFACRATIVRAAHIFSRVFDNSPGGFSPGQGGNWVIN
jgi:hypothetical protein